MATISRDKKVSFGLQTKFELTYTAIILVILLMLNTYPLTASQNLIFKAKQSSLESSVSLLVSSLAVLDELTEASQALTAALAHFRELEADARHLKAYYTGSEWMLDFEDDAAGKLPEDLKRGVLSEDAVFDCLADRQRLKEELHS